MPESPLSEICVCGVTLWHTMVDRVIWCRKCGALRMLRKRRWMIPLDRAGDLDLSSTATGPDPDKEPKTDPGTPHAKKTKVDD
jgi:hypothetical protein